MPMPLINMSRGYLKVLSWSLLGLPLGIGANFALGGDLQPDGNPQFDDLVHQGEAADARFDPNGALPFYLKAHAERPADIPIMLKIAKEYSDSTIAIPEAEEDRRRIEKALEYSNRAVELDPHNAVALLSKAICYGKLAGYSDTREKIEYVRLVKQFADQALAEDPKYAYAHHVLGQWEYQVAALGRTKQFLVALVFGGLPPASTQEGVHQLQLAVELEPNIASHRLALGFAYIANGEPGKARPLFEEVVAMPCRELYDVDCHRQATKALAGM
jgi:tetratricopeptide (TPR) repeat protein